MGCLENNAFIDIMHMNKTVHTIHTTTYTIYPQKMGNNNNTINTKSPFKNNKLYSTIEQKMDHVEESDIHLTYKTLECSSVHVKIRLQPMQCPFTLFLVDNARIPVLQPRYVRIECDLGFRGGRIEKTGMYWAKPKEGLVSLHTDTTKQDIRRVIAFPLAFVGAFHRRIKDMLESGVLQHTVVLFIPVKQVHQFVMNHDISVIEWHA